MIKTFFDLNKNEKRENKGKYFIINENPTNNLSKQKQKIVQYPQVINNYDVNVKVNIEKLNDNKISIENMNISEIINRKIESINNKKNKISKYNTLGKNDKKEYLNKTDNNINFLNYINLPRDNKYNYIINDISNNILNINKNKNDYPQNENHYNNMISNLKSEFQQITKGKRININNVFQKEKKSENIRNFLFNAERNNIQIANNKKLAHNKKHSWNVKSKNKNNNKNEEINTENNSIKDIDDNKLKTQNNFYKIPNEHIRLNNDSGELKLTEKNREKTTKIEKNSQNLKKAFIFINKKNGNKLNLTDNNLQINNINEDNSLNNFKDNKNKNNYFNITSNKDNSFFNLDENNIKERIPSYKNSKQNKQVINKSNSFMSKKNYFPFNKNQSFIIDEKNKEKNKINKILETNNSKPNSKEKIDTINNNKSNQPKLYLDKRINKIKIKMINKMKNENNINDSNNDIKNIKLENNISFSYIKNYDINKNNELNEKSLKIINKILNIQSNIIMELKQKQFILKNDLNKKNKEIINLKNICMKLMYFVKSENAFLEKNKKVYLIQNQIIEENKILRKLFLNKQPNDIKVKENNNILNVINEEIIFNNAIKKLKEKENNNNNENEVKKERLITLENNGRIRRERDYFVDKKRNKSYERINDKNKKEKINNSFNNEINILKNKENYFNLNDYINKNNVNNTNSNNENTNKKIGKKIKYLTKDKNGFGIYFDDLNS